MKRFEIEFLKEVVEDVLEKYPVARNSDRELIFRVLVSQGLVMHVDGGIMIPYKNLGKLPSFESITRCRRKIQAEGRFLPCGEVMEARTENEQAMREINKWFPFEPAPKNGRLF
jgi:hypothetical protein